MDDDIATSRSTGGDSTTATAAAHFVLVPMMAQGHAIPMTDMARLLAEHGVEVSLVTTPVNAGRMAGFIAGVEEVGLAVRLVEIPFPAADFGLPDGCENVDMLPSKDLFSNFLLACGALRQPLAARLREQQRRPPVSCVIADMIHWWTSDIARELGVPWLTFNGSCTFASFARHIIQRNNLLENITDDQEIVKFPGFPTPLELPKAKCPGVMCVPGIDQIRDKIYEEEMRSDGRIMNSFQELEALYIESFQQTIGQKIWAVGPMCLCHRDSNAIASRGNKASMDDTECLQWLDSKKPGSVVFVSFGSLASTEPQQLVELGLGLEASKKPFIWVIKAGKKLSEVEEWLTDGFEERVKDRGMIIRGWAPQMMILWHQAIGLFMTHCGWNSTIEGICAGVPMITWPHFAEQFVNEKLVVDHLKIGVEIGVKGATQWGSEQKEVKVTRDAVETAVSMLMNEGEAAQEIRMRAKDFGMKARKALEERGSSYNNIKLMIQEMGNRKNTSAAQPCPLLAKPAPVDQQRGSMTTTTTAHFMLVPMMAQGHTIPMTDLARLLAEHGAQVSLVTTPVNAARMAGFIAGVEEAGLAVQLVQLPFPAAEFGLPDGCENLDMLQSKDHMRKFLEACGALREPLMARLRQHCLLPSCIISDMMHWWTSDIARELGIPWLTFSGFCTFASLARDIVYRDNLLWNHTDDEEIVKLLGFPTPLELPKARLPGSLCVPGLEEIREKIYDGEMQSDGKVVNSFHELETLYIESYKQATGKKVWTVGPMCLCHRDRNTMAARGNKASLDEAKCLQWLDSKKPGSVIFVSFGSLASTAPQQLVELGLGLEASNKPFFWVIKAGNKFPEIEEWLADGFEERVKDRGMIIRGWAPQMMILWHQAIGGFMTHCGWNSTIEGICAGVPMITWPHFAEQFLNEKLVVDHLKIGVEVGVKGVAQWGIEQNEVMVTKNAVEIAVSTLMNDEEAAEEMRMRAKDFGVKARKALEEGGSSYNNIRSLIQEMGNKQNASG
uniref:Glycosyltransferase N-terminal domain-containing protein n=1 Tax=Leersia perrieri TaxID=77586 RepID=A0A0D9UXF2_9ORYZ